MSQAAAKYMAKQSTARSLTLLNVVLPCRQVHLPYTAAKHGVLGLTKAYADALSKYNIQVKRSGTRLHLTDMTKALAEDPVRGLRSKNIFLLVNGVNPEQLMGPMVF